MAWYSAEEAHPMFVAWMRTEQQAVSLQGEAA